MAQIVYLQTRQGRFSIKIKQLMKKKRLLYHALLGVMMLGVTVMAVLNKPPGLYIDIKNIYIGAGIPAGYSTTFALLQPLPNVISSCLSLYNFQTINSNSVLSYIAELSFPNSTSATLFFDPVGANSNIQYIVFCILAVTESYPNCELLVFQRPVAGFTWDGMEYSAPAIYISSSAFNFTVTSSSQMSCYLMFQWITMSSPSVIAEVLYTKCAFVPSSSLLEVSLYGYVGSTIDRFKMSAFLHVDATYNNTAEYNNYYNLGTNYPALSLPAQLGVPTGIFGRPKNQMRCFFGIPKIILSIGTGTITFRYTFTGSGANAISGATDFTTFPNIILYVVCLAQCPLGLYLQLPGTCLICTIPKCLSCTSPTLCLGCEPRYALSILQDSCLSCSSVIQGCYDCSSTICTQCYPEYALVINATCQLCRLFIANCSQCSSQTVCTSCFLGEPVIGGCTTVLGCVEVQYSAGENVCLKCNSSQYQTQPVNRQCVCLKGGNIIGGHCTTVFGCISIQIINSQVECMTCDVNLNLHLNPTNYQCECLEGYAFDSNSCLAVCGDGLVFSSEECDDGNNDNGDGCSSICQLETNYRCQSNSTKNPSLCQYIGSPLSITLINTQKTSDANEGIFTFSFSPKMSLLSRYNFQDFFQFSCVESTYQVKNWSYANGEATLIVDYQTDLEARPVLVNFTFNQLFIRHAPVILEFTVKSNGVMLIISDNSIKSVVLKYFLLGVAALSLLLLIVGSSFHQMVGIELVNCLQVIYYMHYTVQKYTPAFSSLQELSLVGVNDLFLEKNKQNFISNDEFQKVSYSMVQTQIGLLGLTLCILILGIVFLLFFFAFPQLCNKKSEKCFQKTSNLLLNGLLFPLSSFLLLPFLLILFTFSTQVTNENFLYPIPLKALLLGLAMTCISLIYFSKLKNLFTSSSNNIQMDSCSIRENSYIPAYLVYLFIQTALLISWIRTAIAAFFYILLALQCLILFWVLRVRPYRLIFENVSIVFNFSLIIVFQIFLVLREQGVFNTSEETDIFCLLIVLGVIALCSILSIVRFGRTLFQTIRQEWAQKIEKVNSQKCKQKEELNEEEIEFRKIHKNMTKSHHILQQIYGETNRDKLLRKISKESEEDPILLNLKEKKRREFRQKCKFDKKIIKKANQSQPFS